ncbi:MAG: hypothetical protein KIS91_11970 [Anaerolineae bacterium]|nr:hypothetical protein [Anaerolineae bacterium]
MNPSLFPWEFFVLFLLLGAVLLIVYFLNRTRDWARWTLYGGVAGLVLGVGLLLGGIVTGASFDFGMQPVLTSPTAPPALRSRVYTTAPPNDVVREVIIAAESQRSWGRRWQVVSQRMTPISGGTLQIAVPGPLWNDVLAVAVRSEEGGVQVDAQGRSPVGPLSFGGARRSVAQFLAAVDERMAQR